MADFLVPTVQEEPVMTVALDAVVGLAGVRRNCLP